MRSPSLRLQYSLSCKSRFSASVSKVGRSTRGVRLKDFDERLETSTLPSLPLAKVRYEVVYEPAVVR